MIGIIFGIAIPSWLTFFYLYGVLAFYFTWYWRRNGQTLAMQTWRIQLITVPCLVIHTAYPLRGWQIISVLFVVSLFLWPLTIYIDRKNRQGLPDRIAGTKLVELPRYPNKKGLTKT